MKILTANHDDLQYILVGQQCSSVNAYFFSMCKVHRCVCVCAYTRARTHKSSNKVF